MTSVAPLPFQDVLGNVSSGFGFAHVNALVLCCEPDVTPQLLVPQTSCSNQCYGAEQKATEEPRRPVMALVSSNVAGKKAQGNQTKSSANKKPITSQSLTSR